jgi:hypothetical protein
MPHMITTITVGTDWSSIMTRRLSFVLFMALICGSFAFSAPAQVIIIRHAEKPASGDDLNAKGRMRAAALVPYFLEAPEVLEYKTPIAIYAQKSTDSHKSRRPVDTVKGIASALKQDLIEYPREDALKMVKDIMAKPEYEGRMVLICWSHTGIPDMARAFGVKEVPEWSGSVYDRNWIITFDKGTVNFKNVPQKLMYGDSDK